MKVNRVDLLKDIIDVAGNKGKHIIFNRQFIGCLNLDIIILKYKTYDFEAVVSPRELIEFLTKSKSEFVEIEKKKDSLVFITDKVKFTTSCLDEKYEIPESPKEWEVLQEGFSDMLACVLESASEVGPEYYRYIFFYEDKIFSCNSYHMTLVDTPISKVDFAISIKAVEILAKNKINKVSTEKVKEGIVHFLSEEGIHYAIAVVDIKAPNFSKVLEHFEKIGSIKFPEESKEILQQIQSTLMGTASDEKAIKFSLDKGILYITSKGQTSEAVAQVICETEGSADILINPEFLLSALKYCDEAQFSNVNILFRKDNITICIALID